MYSPKIDEELVPVLYHAAKAMGVPMTRLVTILIGKALAAEDLPGPVREAITRFVASSQPHNAGT